MNRVPVSFPTRRRFTITPGGRYALSKDKVREKLDLLKEQAAENSGGKDFLAAMSPLERTLFVIDESKVNPELVEVALRHIVSDADMQVPADARHGM